MADGSCWAQNDIPNGNMSKADDYSTGLTIVQRLSKMVYTQCCMANSGLYSVLIPSKAGLSRAKARYMRKGVHIERWTCILFLVNSTVDNWH